MRDLYELLTGKNKCSIKEYTYAIKEFMKEKEYQDEAAKMILEKMTAYVKGDKSSHNALTSDNQYLNLQNSLGAIGNHDCSKLSFDEGLYILLEHNKRIHEENRKIEKK